MIAAASGNAVVVRKLSQRAKKKACSTRTSKLLFEEKPGVVDEWPARTEVQTLLDRAADAAAADDAGETSLLMAARLAQLEAATAYVFSNRYSELERIFF